MTTISGLIVAHNEQDVIEEALKSLTFCDEIVVCLHNCTDATQKIAEKYADNIIEGDDGDGWDIEGVRRMAGINACASDWIFELDADERVTPELAKSLQHIAASDTRRGHYMVAVDNYVGDRLVKYGWAGSFGTTRVARFFTKGSKVWGQQRVHPKVELGERLGWLRGSIQHLVDSDLDDMIDRLQRYSTARAKDMAAKPLPPFRKTLRQALTRFYKSYFARKGYKEGRMGFMLALMAALFMILSHIKAEIELVDKK